MSATSPTTPENPITGRDVFSPLFGAVRHVVSFLKWRFSLLPAGAYRFDPDSDDSPEQKNSEIYIGADTPIKASVVGKRPAITVLRATAAFQGIGLGDLAFHELSTGAKVRMDLIPTNLVINVLSQLPVEAEGIAWFVQQQISAFREEIIKSERTILYLGNRPMFSPPTPAGAIVQDATDYDWCVVVVSFPMFLQYATTLLPLNKKILAGVDIHAVTTGPVTPADPAVPIQGTAVMQPPQTAAEQAAAVSPLPQEGPDEAQSSQPLAVTIQTR